MDKKTFDVSKSDIPCQNTTIGQFVAAEIYVCWIITHIFLKVL